MISCGRYNLQNPRGPGGLKGGVFTFLSSSKYMYLYDKRFDSVSQVFRGTGGKFHTFC